MSRRRGAPAAASRDKADYAALAAPLQPMHLAAPLRGDALTPPRRPPTLGYVLASSLTGGCPDMRQAAGHVDLRRTFHLQLGRVRLLARPSVSQLTLRSVIPKYHVAGWRPHIDDGSGQTAR